MRRFVSYGPINNKLHYYAPRKELIGRAYNHLMGENPSEGGHYITVWAPRQTGKTWVMQEVVEKIKQTGKFEVGIISMERAKEEKEEKEVLEVLIEKLQIAFNRSFPGIEKIKEAAGLFTKQYFQKPVILILDEFDALEEVLINRFASIFRDIFVSRTNEREKTSREKTYLLHGLALVGVRSVLGIENPKGSPFNVQRSVHIPNLTFAEVDGMFKWYEKESGQKVEEAVVRELYEENRGQPGLTCWFGELLTETYNHDTNKPITMYNFEEAYGAATHILPNNNILNIISKVNKPPYDETVIELFETSDKIEFKFNNKVINYLYMNGVIDEEKVGINEYYVKFSCPFIQKCLFDYFSNQIFSHLGQLIHPLDAMKDAIDEKSLHIPNIIKRYQAYLKKKRVAPATQKGPAGHLEGFLNKTVPLLNPSSKIQCPFNGNCSAGEGETFNSDTANNKIGEQRKSLSFCNLLKGINKNVSYEAIYHFNLYRYLYDLLKKRGVEVIPHFPTGNGKVDLILKYREKIYALELKSFKDMYTFEKGIDQAAEYGRQMGLKEIVFLVFVELKEEEVKELEQEIEKPGIKVIVIPVGIL